MPATRIILATVLAVLAATLPACSTEVIVADDPDAVDGPDPGPSHVDLWSCGLPETCAMSHAHAGSVWPEEALTCNAQLLLGGGPGTMRSSAEPGPHFWQDQMLVILLGNGKALVQERARNCFPDEDMPPECDDPDAEVPWQPLPPSQLCDVHVDEDLVATCEADEMACRTYAGSGLANCAEVDDFTCDEVATYFE